MFSAEHFNFIGFVPDHVQVRIQRSLCRWRPAENLIVFEWYVVYVDAPAAVVFFFESGAGSRQYRNG